MGCKRHLRLLWAACLLGFAGCASLAGVREQPADWELDPQGCAGIRLRADVPIRVSVLEASTAFPGRSWHVLEYVELPHATGFSARRPAVFRNVFRVTVLGKGEGEPELIERYQVIDLWTVYPGQDLKICRQWTLHEQPGGELAEGTLQLLGFNGENVLLEEIRRSLSVSELEALTEVHVRIREHFRAALQDGSTEQRLQDPD